ncbi:unnamed protein product [Orchesella dallaii]|uniref:Protein kinase domain-containing protein n=1 Tax=Orchesella dallaii TaxID=48710 RepID=A0ABP1R309_9HEXA
MKEFSKVHFVTVFLGIFWQPASTSTSQFSNQFDNGTSISSSLKDVKFFDVTRRVNELLKRRDETFVTDATFLIKKAMELSPNLIYGLHDGIDFELISNVTNLINKIHLDHIFDNVTAKPTITFLKIGLAKSDIAKLSSQFANHTLQPPHRLMLLEKIARLPPFEDTPCVYNGSSSSLSSNSERLTEEFKVEILRKYGSQVVFGIDLLPQAMNCPQTPDYLQSPHTKNVVLTFIMQMTYFYQRFLEQVMQQFNYVSYLVSKFNPDAQILLRIAIPIWVGDVTLENHLENQILLAEYAIKTANALTGPVGVIIDFFNLKFEPAYVNIMKRKECSFMNDDKFSELLIEKLLRDSDNDEEGGMLGVAFDHYEVDNDILMSIGPIFNPMKLTSDFKSAELRTKLPVMSRKFKNILMSYGTLKKLVELKEENGTIYQPPIFSNTVDIILLYEDSLANEDAFIKTLSNLVTINEQYQEGAKITAFVLNDVELINGSRWDVIRNLTEGVRNENNSKIEFGLSIPLGNILDSSKEDIINVAGTNFHLCNAVFQPCDILIWKFTINPFSFQFDRNSLDRKYKEVESTLRFVMMLRSYVMELAHPEFQVIIHFEWHRIPGTKKELIIYCDSDLERNLNVINGMVMWALINKIPVISMTAFQDMMRFGWWRNLLWAQTTYEPDSLLYIDRNEVPCITEDKRPITSEIKFNLDSTGISMYFNLKNDSKTQIDQKSFKTMLRFVAKKFQIIDLIFNPNVPASDLLDDINSTLSTARALPEVEESEKHPGLKLYFTIPFSSFEKEAENSTSVNWQTNKLYSIIKQSPKSKVSFEGFTITNVSSPSIATAEKLMSNVRAEGVPVGYFLKDCMLIKEKTLPEYEQHLVTLSNYAICDKESNYTIESTFLDYYFRVLLTIKRRFTHYFPKTELIFRIKMSTPRTLNDGDKEFDEKYLRFWHDFNKFANAQKIRYFLSPAFDKQYGEARGWWKVDDYSDLSNKSVYYERESEFLGRETWRPEDKSVVIPNTSVFMILSVTLFTLLTISFLAFTVVLVLVKRRQNLLRLEEADEFFNGSSSTSSSGSQTSLDILSPYMLAGVNVFLKEKYDMRFEIPKKEIEFGSPRKILGEGNFGAVYEAVCRGNLVAVKVPHPRSDKETFKSMLAEVKIMSCMGAHVNVLNLLGAHTGEIRTGKLYIITELCKNGSLQNYLRGLKDKLRAAARNSIPENSGDVPVDSSQDESSNYSINNIIYELWQFSQEIASGMDYIGGVLPYPGLEWSSTFVDELILDLRMGKPQYSSDEIYNEILKTWKEDPEERPTFTELAETFRRLRITEYDGIAN